MDTGTDSPSGMGSGSWEAGISSSTFKTISAFGEKVSELSSSSSSSSTSSSALITGMSGRLLSSSSSSKYCSSSWWSSSISGMSGSSSSSTDSGSLSSSGSGTSSTSGVGSWGVACSSATSNSSLLTPNSSTGSGVSSIGSGGVSCACSTPNSSLLTPNSSLGAGASMTLNSLSKGLGAMTFSRCLDGVLKEPSTLRLCSIFFSKSSMKLSLTLGSRADPPRRTPLRVLEPSGTPPSSVCLNFSSAVLSFILSICPSFKPLYGEIL